ncbi:MAG: DMT family transporter, partial [Candidatus Micrarchaeota archaeon]
TPPPPPPPPPRPPPPRVERAHFPYILLSGIIALDIILYNVSLTYTSAINVGVLFRLSAVMIVIGGIIFFHEKLKIKNALAVFLALVGAYLMIANGHAFSTLFSSTTFLGDILVILSGACFAIYSLVGKKLAPVYGSLQSTRMSFGLSVLIMLAVLLALGQPLIPSMSAFAWLLLLVLGVFHAGISFSLWYEALETLDSASAVVTYNLAPISTIIFAYLVLPGEALTTWSALGTALIILGVSMSANERK